MSERAEDTARILDVHYHLLLEDRWVDEASACRALLEVMGLPDAVQRRDRLGPFDQASRLRARLPGVNCVCAWKPPGKTLEAPGRRSRPRCGNA